MDCTIRLELQLLIQLECIEEGKDSFCVCEKTSQSVFFVHCYVSLLDTMMRKMSFWH